MTESWMEVRCIFCKQLGYQSSHLLLRVKGGNPPEDDVKLTMVCPRCKTHFQWTLGKPDFKIIKEGKPNPKQNPSA